MLMSSRLTGGAFVAGRRADAARRPTGTRTESPNVKMEFSDGAAEGVAMHAKLACCLALIAPVFLQHGQNKALLEFADGFGIKNPALVHLQNQCFQLIFHSASLYEMRSRSSTSEVLVQGTSSLPCRRDARYVPVPYAAGSSHRGSAAGVRQAPPKSTPVRLPA